MYVEHTLGAEGTNTKEPGDDAFEVIEDSSAAMEFLERHPSGLLLLAIDTHSLDNGFFTYTGNDPASLMGCGLLEVRLIQDHTIAMPHLTSDLDTRRLPP